MEKYVFDKQIFEKKFLKGSELKNLAKSTSKNSDSVCPVGSNDAGQFSGIGEEELLTELIHSVMGEKIDAKKLALAESDISLEIEKQIKFQNDILNDVFRNIVNDLYIERSKNSEVTSLSLLRYKGSPKDSGKQKELGKFAADVILDEKNRSLLREKVGAISNPMDDIVNKAYASMKVLQEDGKEREYTRIFEKELKDLFEIANDDIEKALEEYDGSAYENLPGNSLTFLGIRHSESSARAGYDRTQETSKIMSQINAMPIIEWTDYDVWLYILAKNLLINDCYQYGYKRVGCWCCPNNSDWSMMLTEIYHPEDMRRWKEMIYNFADKTGKTDPDDYYEGGRWKTRRGASGLKVKNVTITDTACNLSDRARNVIVEKRLQKDVIEFFKPLGDLKIVEKKDATYIQIFDHDKSGEYRKICELIITYGTTVIKVLPEERIDATNLVNRIKCQMRKYQFCIRCSACDSTCPYGAIDTIHGKYTIDETKCRHCKHCIAKFYNGCIMCDVLSSKKGSQ